MSTTAALTDLYDNPSAFRPITTGSNGYAATTGYNLVAGLGSPDVAAVINALIAPVAAAPTTTTGTTTTILATPTTSSTTTTTTTTHRPATGQGTHTTGTSTTTPAIATAATTSTGLLFLNPPAPIAPPTIQILNGSGANTASSPSATDGGTATSATASTASVVAQTPVAQPIATRLYEAEESWPILDPMALDRTPSGEDPAPAFVPLPTGDEPAPADPEDEPKGQPQPADEATAPEGPQAWLDRLFPPHDGAFTQVHALRAATPPAKTEPEADRAEEPGPSLSFGLGVASLAALRWEIRRRRRGQTHGDPLPLVRTTA